MAELEQLTAPRSRGSRTPAQHIYSRLRAKQRSIDASFRGGRLESAMSELIPST